MLLSKLKQMLKLQKLTTGTWKDGSTDVPVPHSSNAWSREQGQAAGRRLPAGLGISTCAFDAGCWLLRQARIKAEMRQRRAEEQALQSDSTAISAFSSHATSEASASC